MELLIDSAGKRTVASLYNDLPARVAGLEAGERLPLLVGVVNAIPQPWSARLFNPQSLSTATLMAKLGAAASTSLSTSSASAGITVATVQTGGSGRNHQVRVTLTGNIYAGTWLFSALGAQSGPIGYNHTAAQLQSVLAAIAGVGSGNVTVSQEDFGTFLVTFVGSLANTTITGVGVDGTNLTAIDQRSGTMDLSVQAVTDLLGTDEQTVVPLEIWNGTALILRRDVLLKRAPGTVASTDGLTGYTKSAVDAMIAGMSGSSPLITVAAAGTFDLAPPTAFSQWYQKVVANAGSGAYTANLTLNRLNPRVGAIYRVSLELPANGNPTLNIYDGTTAGTLLESITGDSSNAQYFVFEAEWDGSAWHKVSGEFVT